MKKHLLTGIVAIAACLGVANAQGPAKIAPRNAMAEKVEVKATQTLNLSTFVAGLYDPSYEVPNYYLVLSTDKNATYDKKTGSVKITTGYLLTIDLYNIPSTDYSVIPDVYLPNDDFEAGNTRVYDPDYTMLIYYSNGTEKASQKISGPIRITKDDTGVYSISASIPNGDQTIELNYNGRLPMTNTREKESPYAQFKHDVTVNMKAGGIAFYQGVTDYSLNGVTYLNIYSNDFDKETGSMTQPGWHLAMMLAHKRVVRRNDFTLFPGTYENATNLSRFTWYPCRDITYVLGDQQITTQFGSFIRELNPNANDRYTYGYLASGTFVLEDAGDGKYTGYLDAVTDLGFTVKVNFEGEFTLNAGDNFSATLSELTDDVDLDFSKLETGRVWHRGFLGGCRDFTIDLGSPSGRDEGINYGGDLLRMEFLCPQRDAVLKSGVYPVSIRRWNSYELQIGAKYEPNTLAQYRWDSGGGLDGTRYAHFEEGRYCVYDVTAPVIEGEVTVYTEDFLNYRFDIKLLDDAGFEIRGVWDGPVEYMYDAENLKNEIATGIEGISSDSNISAVVEGSTIVVLNGGDRAMTLYNINGVAVASGKASQSLDVSSLAKGLYILKIDNTTIKVAL